MKVLFALCACEVASSAHWLCLDFQRLPPTLPDGHNQRTIAIWRSLTGSAKSLLTLWSRGWRLESRCLCLLFFALSVRSQLAAPRFIRAEGSSPDSTSPCAISCLCTFNPPTGLQTVNQRINSLSDTWYNKESAARALLSLSLFIVEASWRSSAVVSRGWKLKEGHDVPRLLLTSHYLT